MKTHFKPLQFSFYAQSALEVAPSLLGKIIHCNEVSLIITETEAYLPNDSACHAYRGRTARNEPMYSEGGVLYVYLCYGLHNLCNVVVGQKGIPSAVLLRAAMINSGTETVQQRRKGKIDLIGPGKVGQALGVSTKDSGRTLVGDIFISNGYSPINIRTAPRVGIEYALPKDREAKWRYIADSFKITV
jgi:DNA-3-methyladenine glycosylase